jgi:hypothetical protein
MSPPLKRIAPVEQSFLQITRRGSPNLERRDLWFDDDDDRRVRHTDTIRITVHALSDVFHLHLRPNEDLIHPAASISHYRTTTVGSVVEKVEPLRREQFLVFGGEVVDDDHTDVRLDEDFAGGIRRPQHAPSPKGHRGWARIMVLGGGEDDEYPLFEGAFSVDGIIHHVLTKDNYLRTMLPGDPEPDADEELVIFRDIDVMSHIEAESMRTGIPMAQLRGRRRPQMCAHDRLGYNVDKMNPVLRYGAGLYQPSRGGWFDPLGFLSSSEGDIYDQGFQKRQGDIVGGANSSSKYDFFQLPNFAHI